MKSRSAWIRAALLGLALIALWLWVSRRDTNELPAGVKPSAPVTESAGEDAPVEDVANRMDPVVPVVATAEESADLGVMPLDAASVQAFQLASSQCTRELLEREPDLSSGVASAMGLRQALTDLGYDPDRCLITWLRHEQNPPHPTDAHAIRLTESLLNTALGTSAGEGDRAQILNAYSRDVQQAVRGRTFGNRGLR